jgi:hypothetical protein
MQILLDYLGFAHHLAYLGMANCSGSDLGSNNNLFLDCSAHCPYPNGMATFDNEDYPAI